MVSKLFFFFIFFLGLSIRIESCVTRCGNKEINFPFQLRNQSDEYRCGYQGFDLLCNNSTQTIIAFPSSGDFSVDTILYYEQYIEVGDPAGCIAKRLLQGFDPSGTPFQQLYLQNFTFLNCSVDVPTLQFAEGMAISCLSDENSSVLAIPDYLPDLLASLSTSCLNIGTVSLSVPEYLKVWEYLSDSNSIWLRWNEPDCKGCLTNQGTCRYKENTGLDVGCFGAVVSDQEKKSSSGSTKYFMVSTVCLLGLVICIPCMIKRCIRKWKRPNSEISTPTIPQSTRKGLAERTIEMYPTTLLGESLQLPKPNDTTCSICLLEYQAKDTLRTIPSCMHYFHAHCIDEWLKRNATCPLCRE